MVKSESWDPLRTQPQGKRSTITVCREMDDVISTAQRGTAPAAVGRSENDLPWPLRHTLTMTLQRWPGKGSGVWRRGIGHFGQQVERHKPEGQETTLSLHSNRPALPSPVTVTAVKPWNYHGPMNWSVIHNGLPFTYSLECYFNRSSLLLT